MNNFMATHKLLLKNTVFEKAHTHTHENTEQANSDTSTYTSTEVTTKQNLLHLAMRRAPRMEN